MDNNYNNDLEQMLRESITHFLAVYQKGSSSDFSCFGSIFSRLIQTMTDPPLEITWFYTAVAFHSSPSKKSLKAANDLFQLLISCSTPCNNGLKRVAMLAPVLCQLYYIALDWRNMVSCLKREVENLVEGIISFISIYCSRSSFELESSSDKLMSGFVDLLRIWTVEKCDAGDATRLFFPLVSDEVRDVVRTGGVSDLAGIVMTEVFFMRLCLKLDSNLSREALWKDLHNWAVQAIKGFQNCHFLDMLLIALLEPNLPINNLVTRDVENLLREVLCDAVTLAYSSLSSHVWDQLPDQKFAIRWLLVADAAVQYARESCDQSRVLACISAFSKCCLRSKLIKWVAYQAGLAEEFCRPNVPTPRALIRWLLTLEDQHYKIFGHYISRVHGNEENEKPKSNSNYPIGSIYICFEDNLRGQSKVNHDHEMVDFSDGTSVANEEERRKKRKEEHSDEGEIRLKLAKINHN